jgi:Tfp pilus assembly protein PilW
MLMMELSKLDDERGTTIIELLVGMAMGTVVMMGLSIMIIVTLHGNARVDARVEATDNARVAVAQITEELHSACVSPQIAPVQENSTGNSLVFWHAATGEATAVAPNPVKSKITYSGGKLTQTDYALTGGTSPHWTFELETAGKTRTLLTNVAPATGSSTVFSYEKYENGSFVPVPATATSELKEKATTVIVVKVGLTASPKSTPVRDAGAAATVRDSATLRLTPPAFEGSAAAVPCQ